MRDYQLCFHIYLLSYQCDGLFTIIRFAFSVKCGYTKINRHKATRQTQISGVCSMNEEQELFLKTLREKISELPFHRLLGLNASNFDIENGCIRFEMRDELVGNSSL